MKIFVNAISLFFFLLADVASTSFDGSARRLGDLTLDELNSKGDQTIVHLVELQVGACSESDVKSLIEDLGGSISYIRIGESVDLAIVAGLVDEEKVNTVKASNCVADVVEDDSFLSDEEVTEPQAFDATIQSPDDPESAILYQAGYQWNMELINAKEAWDNGVLGSDEVTVAILDSGVDPYHPDLAGRVDDVTSTSFIPYENWVIETFLQPWPIYTDLGYHGTHVANTVVSNGYLTAGVTSKSKVMAVKVCTVFGDGGCPMSAVFAGILHAVDNGADVINMSLGGPFSKTGSGSFVGYINRVLNYANRKGVTVIVAAGNDSSNLGQNGNVYEAFCDTPNTMCVSATNIDDEPSYYTNFGNSAIDVAAPGGGIAAPVWAACSSTTLILDLQGCRAGTSVLGISGTSMASPHVAGLAALVVADGAKSPGQVKSRIRKGADDLGKNGQDPYYGKGRINVAATIL